jgi:HD-like signal output (HDOD) protein
MARDEWRARAEAALVGKTLSGVVMEVVALAASPRGDVAQVAALVARDPVLSVRVLQVASSAAYGGRGGPTASVADAVKRVGCAAVRNAAAALGIFDAMPATAADGFNPIRCWQHAVAVAQLCERLVTPADEKLGGVAFLVGLCHDLADVCFHTHFAAEYAGVLDAHAATGRPLPELELELMGVTREALLATILAKVGLPDSIRAPIAAFHEADRAGRVPVDRLARVLRLADRYATGLLLAPGGGARLSALTAAECKAAVGNEHPPCPDAVAFRNEILTLTGVLARLGPADLDALTRPAYPPAETRVWLARDATFSTFDPVAAALGALARTVSVQNRLPLAPREWDGYDALVVSARGVGASGIGPAEAAKSLAHRPGGPAPCLWTSPRREEGAPPPPPTVRVAAGAVSLDELAAFVGSSAARRAA